MPPQISGRGIPVLRAAWSGGCWHARYRLGAGIQIFCPAGSSRPVAAIRGNEVRTFVSAINGDEAALQIAGLQSFIQPSLLHRELTVTSSSFADALNTHGFSPLAAHVGALRTTCTSALTGSSHANGRARTRENRPLPEPRFALPG